MRTLRAVVAHRRKHARDESAGEIVALGFIEQSCVDELMDDGGLRGGVETGETILTALERELREEGDIELTEPPVFHAVYFNQRASRRDHVALYIVRSFRQTAPPQPNREIVAHGFFATDALPADTARATRERIAEVLTGRPPAQIW